VRFDTLVGAALAAITLLAGCASQGVENYDSAQCGALGGALVRQSSEWSQPRSGFRVETQRCVFSPGPSLRESP
jgi:outer membrane murein-binding lipoprotein Lpp